MNKRVVYALVFAVLVGFAARLPGVFWGSNFPFGWYGHHPDEYTHAVNAEQIIYPAYSPRWTPNPYPKGLGAHVGAPILLNNRLRGIQRVGTTPHPKPVIVAGRVIVVVYGAATVLAMFLLGSVFFRDRRVPLFAAWITALGGLHVTQSHFFVSDVPGMFWLILGLYFLAREIRDTKRDERDVRFLLAASFAFGVAFGLKLIVAGVPSLAIVLIRSGPRVARIAQSAVYALAGFVMVNVGFFTPHDLWKTIKSGISSAEYSFSRLDSLRLYFLELPSVLSAPIAVLAIVGGVGLARKLISAGRSEDRATHVLVGALPLAVSCLLLLRVDHFPRHVLTLFPWFFLGAAWSLARIAAWLETRNRSPAWAVAPLFVYLAVFVYDGERGFLDEPRNRTAEWMRENVAAGTEIQWERKEWIEEYEHVLYPDAKPKWLVIEMLNANHYLSGLGAVNSYPDDYRRVFDGRSQDWLEAHQALFRGTAGYTEAARFREGYFMPEYILTGRYLGNRSRNYLSEVLVFERTE